MNITHYVAILEFEYSAKNNLHKAVLEYFRSIDRSLIEVNNLDNFRKAIQSAIQKINNENKRCKPLNIYFDSTSTRKLRCDSIVRDAIVVSFSIRACTYKHISLLVNQFN